MTLPVVREARRRASQSLIVGKGADRMRRIGALFGHAVLLVITSASALAILFIFAFIIRDALPFFHAEGFREFFTSARWYPSAANPEFGALALFAGSALVTAGAILVAAPLGIAAAVCLSDILPFSIRQAVKPVLEILAAIPSVAYGFFALVVLAPFLQKHSGAFFSIAAWVLGAPVLLVAVVVAGDLASSLFTGGLRRAFRVFLTLAFGAGGLAGLYALSRHFQQIEVLSGANALNVSLVLGIMALPTVISVSEDALTAVGRELREGSYALGATRFETIVRVVIPAAGAGILAALLLGVMRAIGETMVVWMASGNAARIPDPWYNFLQPVRTLTATIAGEMGEADHVTGSSRYHVLFALGLCLLVFSFLCNVVSEWAVRRSKRKAA